MNNYFNSSEKSFDVNSLKTIISIVVVNIISVCMFIVQPAYVLGLVEYNGFTESEAGMIASAEMFGLATMAVILNFLVSRFNWRVFTVLFLSISVLGNLLSIGVTGVEELKTIRFITGLGSGGLATITFVMMGLTERSERNFAAIVTGVLIYGALGLLIMPSFLSMFGMSGLLIFFAIFSAAGFIAVVNLPTSYKEKVITQESSIVSSLGLKGITLLAVLVYNLGVGVFWVYAFLVGVDAGIEEQSVANALTVSQFLGIAGAFMVVVLEAKFGRSIPLIVGVLGIALGISLVLGKPSLSFYIVGVCLFNLLWNFTMPYLLSILADLDSKGRMVAIGIALQLIGFAVGPAIAVMLLDNNGYDYVNIVSACLFVSSVVFIIPSLMLLKRQAAVPSYS